MEYRQGDIVWVDWRFIGELDPGKKKPRPCLVISNETCNRLDGDLLLCPITTNIRTNDFSVILDPFGLSRVLPRKSEVRTNKIFTYHSFRTLSKYCKITDVELLRNIIIKVCAAVALVGK